jgi:hypothetical protein
MNQGAFVVILALVVLTIVAVAIAVAYGSHVENRRRYLQLARRFGGVVDHPGIIGTPTVRFHYEGAPVRIRQTMSGREDHSKFIEFRIAWSATSVRLTLRPERTLDFVGKFLGVEDIQIGSREFDARYVISGSNPSAVRSFLTPGVQECINALYRLAGVNHVFLAIQGGYLEVKKLGPVYDFPSLEKFVMLCLNLVDQAQLAGMKGIEFVAKEQGKAKSEVVCQVCGDTIRRSEVVYCKSCRTPHHRDCWNYFGACSTFGCGQTVYKQPKRQRK